MTLNRQAIREKARELGFNIAGLIHAEPAPTLQHYFAWIEAEMHGKMGYMARPDRQARRADLRVIMPDVRSMLLVGCDYRVDAVPESTLSDPARGRIASYAWGADYHDVIAERLEALADWIQAQAGELHHRVYVDTGAILERAHAQQAGMGFIGKNTMLINRRRGSYFFLGEILLNLEFDDYDTPEKPSLCGTCTRCLVACPTDAFPRPYVLDARRCISYLTIENKGVIQRDLRRLMGNWIFGCDVCQDVCPWTRFTVTSDEPAFRPPHVDRAAPRLLDLLRMDDAGFKARFSDTPLARLKRPRLVRNACVAAGNWGDPAALPALLDLLRDPSDLVRGHAIWAIGRITGAERARGLIDPRIQGETDAGVLDEYAALDTI
ncbi:MAG: tRNA epoxyqueuosine(34) reductase QueG [Anaerolineaceae bacterium]|nr:MAG: tRNA epoxyqueuosine(34) reductase QueG [Anaerolineaceae bacterium]